MSAVIRRIERHGDTYVAHTENGVAWTTELRFDMGGMPFREERIWPRASVVAIGGGNGVHFLAIDSGTIVETLLLEHDYFGHFGPDDDEVSGDVLYILGWCHVVAVDATLAVRWISRDIAVEGIVWVAQRGERIILSAEMDPPGGWERVVLDAKNGCELVRGGE